MRPVRWGEMRWFVVALGVGVAVASFACDKLPAPPEQLGQLVFDKDSSCADTTTTELYIDNASVGQFTMRPGSQVGFNVTAGTHIASATERGGLLRSFPSQAVTVPPLGQGFYTYKCAIRPPPATPPVRPGP